MPACRRFPRIVSARRREEAFAEFVDWSLTDVLRGAPDAPGLDRVDVGVRSARPGARARGDASAD